MHTIFHVILAHGSTVTFLNYVSAKSFIEDMDPATFVMVPSVIDQETHDKLNDLVYKD